MFVSTKKSNIITSRYLLYYTYGLMPIITGLDKYFDFFTDWSIYLNHSLPDYLNIASSTLLHIVGIIEIATGLLVFIKPRLGGYIIIAWLLAICINLISMGSHSHEGHDYIMKHYDIVIRDLGLAVGAYVLVLLSKELSDRTTA